MTVRKWLTVAAVAAGLGLGAMPAAAADTKAEYTFGSLKATAPAAAQAQAEAWLKKAGKFDQAAFEKVWTQEEASVLDKTLATLELGSPDAKKVMDAGRIATAEAPKAVPAVLKDEKQDSYFRANLALGFARRAHQRPRVRGIARGRAQGHQGRADR